MQGPNEAGARSVVQTDGSVLATFQEGISRGMIKHLVGEMPCRQQRNVVEFIWAAAGDGKPTDEDENGVEGIDRRKRKHRKSWGTATNRPFPLGE